MVWNIFYFYFPINIGLLIIPIDFHIFQRGGPTTNQTMVPVFFSNQRIQPLDSLTMSLIGSYCIGWWIEKKESATTADVDVLCFDPANDFEIPEALWTHMHVMHNLCYLWVCPIFDPNWGIVYWWVFLMTSPWYPPDIPVYGFSFIFM